MTRVVVLGGGPGGDVAALRAAQLGAEVTLIEEDNVGGTCLNWGCIPTKALLAGADLVRKIRHAGDFGIEVSSVSINFARMMERKDGIVERLRRDVEGACARKHITLRKEHGTLRDGMVEVGGERIGYDQLIVSTGTRAAGLPTFDMSHPRVITSDGALQLKELPSNLVIVGGGVIGCEFASLFASLGSKVTVIEVMDELLLGIDRKVAAFFRSLLEKSGVVCHLGRKVESVREYRDDGMTLVLDDGTVIEGDWTLVAVGRTPRTEGIGLREAGVALTPRGHVEVDGYLHTANPAIWGAGDCIGGLQLAHLASAEGARAAENALGHFVREMDRSVVPATVYTHPEIATVGLNEEMAKAQGHTVKIAQARFVGSGKALGEGESDGYVKLVADRESDLLLGATIIGPHAVESIHEIAVALSDSLTMDDLGSVIHAHPTVSEMVMDAAQHGSGVAPYLS